MEKEKIPEAQGGERACGGPWEEERQRGGEQCGGPWRGAG